MKTKGKRPLTALLVLALVLALLPTAAFATDCEITLSQTTDHVFPTLVVGYAESGLTPLPVTVENTGTQATGVLSVELTGADAGSFTLSKASLPGISAGGTDSFTVAPISGLTPKAYTATVTVFGTGVSKNFDVRFTVEAGVAAPFALVITGLTLSTNNPIVGTPITATVTPAEATANYQWYTNNTASVLHGTEIIGAVSASYTPQAGYVGKYLYCTATGKDGDSGTASAVATAAVSAAPPVPAPAAGTADATYAATAYGGSWRANALTVQADYARFLYVTVDGVQLTVGRDCTVTSGSTVVTFMPAYLATLKDGTHTLRVQFTDGHYNGTFTTPFAAAVTAVAVPNVPATGGALWYRLSLALLCLCGAFAVYKCRRA